MHDVDPSVSTAVKKIKLQRNDVTAMTETQIAEKQRSTSIAKTLLIVEDATEKVWQLTMLQKSFYKKTLKEG